MSEEVKTALDVEVLPPATLSNTQPRSPKLRSPAPSSNNVAHESMTKQLHQLKQTCPMAQLEQDVPWKIVFIVYVLFAVGALILFALFLLIMIRIYKQQVFCS
jgi:hypothetical protein